MSSALVILGSPRNGSLPPASDCICSKIPISSFKIKSFLTMLAKTMSTSFSSSYCCSVTLRLELDPGKIGCSATGTSRYCVIRPVCSVCSTVTLNRLTDTCLNDLLISLNIYYCPQILYLRNQSTSAVDSALLLAILIRVRIVLLPFTLKSVFSDWTLLY